MDCFLYASTRTIEVWDIRSLEPLVHSNIIFRKLNLMGDVGYLENSVESLSCLYAVEHFSLWRYGDPIIQKSNIGFKKYDKNFKERSLFLYKFFLLTSKILFNLMHIELLIPPILNLKFVINNLELQRFDYVDGSGSFIKYRMCR